MNAQHKANDRLPDNSPVRRDKNGVLMAFRSGVNRLEPIFKASPKHRAVTSHDGSETAWANHAAQLKLNKMVGSIESFNADQSARFDNDDNDRADITSGSGQSRNDYRDANAYVGRPWCTNCYRNNEEVTPYCQHCGELGTVTTGEYDAQD